MKKAFFTNYRNKTFQMQKLFHFEILFKELLLYQKIEKQKKKKLNNFLIELCLLTFQYLIQRKKERKNNKTKNKKTLIKY